MNDTTTTTWRGYYRPHKRVPWEQLCSATDYGDAWSALLDLTADRCGHGELLVSRETNPNDAAQAVGPRRRRCF